MDPAPIALQTMARGPTGRSCPVWRDGVSLALVAVIGLALVALVSRNGWFRTGVATWLVAP